MDSTTSDRMADLAKPLTPRSDRRYEGRFAPVSVQTVGGLCAKTRKCFLKDNHRGACYPT